MAKVDPKEILVLFAIMFVAVLFGTSLEYNGSESRLAHVLNDSNTEADGEKYTPGCDACKEITDFMDEELPKIEAENITHGFEIGCPIADSDAKRAFCSNISDHYSYSDFANHYVYQRPGDTSCEYFDVC